MNPTPPLQNLKTDLLLIGLFPCPKKIVNLIVAGASAVVFLDGSPSAGGGTPSPCLPSLPVHAPFPLLHITSCSISQGMEVAFTLRLFTCYHLRLNRKPRTAAPAPPPKWESDLPSEIFLSFVKGGVDGWVPAEPLCLLFFFRAHGLRELDRKLPPVVVLKWEGGLNFPFPF